MRILSDLAVPEILAENPVLKALDPRGLELLLSIARPISYVPGATLLRQGASAIGTFLLRQGSADVVLELPGDDRYTVAQLGPGSVFGEMSLLEQGLCSASVIATGPIDGWFVAREDFRALVAQRSDAAIRVQHGITVALCAKLRALNAKLMAMASPDDRPVAGESAGGKSLSDFPRQRASRFALRDFLPVLPLFREFDADEIDELLACATALEVPRGQPMFAAEDAAAACFAVVRGAVEVSARRGSHMRRLALLGPGHLVGYMAVIDGRPHASSARARENSVLLEIPADDFLALYRGNSLTSIKLQQAVHRNLLNALLHTNIQVTRLTSQARIRAAGDAAQAGEPADFTTLCS